jgi:hypothetical protein
MKRQNTKHYLKLLGMVCLGLASLPVRAGDQTFNFDTDPSLDPLFKLVGSNAGSAWWATGGNPASGGYLELTPAVGSQNLCIVFPDVDQGYPVKAFKLTLDARVGNGTTERPADGFSISYCREGDPVLVNATNGVTGGAAGGDDAATCLSATGSGDLENGTKTGVSILFDAWAGNWWADTGTGGVPGPDSEGIAVRVDDKTLYKLDMSGDRNGNCTQSTTPDVTTCQAAACSDFGTMQTGPWANDGGLLDMLCWAPLIVELDTNKQVTVTWKGHVMLDHFQLSQYNPHRGRLVLMGRTGGNNQNVNFDNIHLVTTPAVEATWGGQSAVGLNGFKFTIEDNGISVVTNVPMVKLDGVDVTSQCTVSKVGGTTTVNYTQAANFLSASTHTIDANWQTTLGQNLGITGQTFTIIPWTTLPESYAVTGVDTARPGFIVQPIQTTAGNPNRLYWTDEQLLGLHGPSLLDLTSVSGVTNANYVAWNDVIDFANDLTPGANGQFFHDTDWAYVGIPSGTDPAQNNSSMAVMAYAYFPTAGTYVFGGNSDDGIRLTFAPNSHSLIGLEVPGMTADVGRGIAKSQNSGGVIVTKPGYYGFRYLFENGGGGCNVEFYTSLTPASSTPLLVNDSTNANSLKVYMLSTAAPPYVSDANPTMNNDTVWPNADLTYKLTDSATTVDLTKVTLTVDDVGQAPNVSKAGNVTTVSLAHTGPLWASGSTHTVVLGYQDNLGTNYTASYTFKVLTYIPVPNIGVALGKEDATKPGFVMNIRAADAGSSGAGVGTMVNRMHVGEQMLAGLYGPNVATVSSTTVPETINFDIAGPDGDFNAAGGYPDVPFPGIPVATTAPTDNFAAEFLTWVEFKTAGVYGMCVNSDDGFTVKYGLERPKQIGQITVISPASIAGDKVAVFPSPATDTTPGAGLIPTNPITAKVVMYKDANGNNLGGAAASNAAELAGNIALIQRGTYSFSVKCANALAAGAKAVIIGQNRPEVTPTDGRFPIEMAGPPLVDIPAVMTDLATYQALTNAVATGEVTATLNPLDMTGVVGSANVGKGASQVNFNVFIPAAGLYPFRTMYEEGNGGANCEWSTFDKTGTHVLLNDTTNPSGLRAFQAVTVAPKPTLSLSTTAGVTTITYTGTLQSSGTANGTYSDVSGATSPYTVNTTTGNQFFRSRN